MNMAMIYDVMWCPQKMEAIHPDNCQVRANSCVFSIVGKRPRWWEARYKLLGNECNVPVLRASVQGGWNPAVNSCATSAMSRSSRGSMTSATLFGKR
jgi:hypothetical protein